MPPSVISLEIDVLDNCVLAKLKAVYAEKAVGKVQSVYHGDFRENYYYWYVVPPKKVVALPNETVPRGILSIIAVCVCPVPGSSR